MRVCVVYDCLYPYTVGGGERWYRGLAERLAAEGHEVTYLSLRQWPRGEEPAIAGVRVRAVGPPMDLYTASGRRRILPPLVFGAGVFAHLLRHGRRYDVLDTGAFPYFSLLAAAALRRAMGYELVVDWFEVWSDEYWHEYLGAAGGRIGAAVQRACARVRQRAVCFSELHARRLREEGLNGSVTVVRGMLAGAGAPTGPAEAAGAAAPTGAPTVLFAGRLIPEKQVGLALAAIARAADDVPGLRGVILGDGPERELLDAEIRRLGLSERVTAPGFAEHDAVAAAMRAALCLLVTSRREGYGLVVVEAAAHGTPSVVVAGPDNAATELIEDGVNGFVAASEDPAEVAAAIARVAEAGEALRRSTATWFSGHARELSLESSLETVLRTYGDGQSSRRPPASARV
jgi:glycosyltransferase involved in cell wall biosynthesis